MTDMRPSWATMYMSMAYLVAMRSPDESTKVGSVITTEDHVLLAIGYNGLPRGMENTPKRQERPGKYFYFEHGERNAIYNASRIGANMTLAHTLYVPWIPCADCARAIIQTGVKEVIIHKYGQAAFDHSRGVTAEDHGWNDSQEAAFEMFKECGVLATWYEGEILAGLTGYYSGQDYTFPAGRFIHLDKT